jgi:hypothetical protein
VQDAKAMHGLKCKQSIIQRHKCLPIGKRPITIEDGLKRFATKFHLHF